MSVSRDGDLGVSADGLLRAADSFGILQQRRLIFLQLDEEASRGLRSGLELFLAVHGIERDDAVREVEFTEQLLGGWDFVGFVRDIDVREDQVGDVAEQTVMLPWFRGHRHICVRGVHDVEVRTSLCS